MHMDWWITALLQNLKSTIINPDPCNMKVDTCINIGSWDKKKGPWHWNHMIPLISWQIHVWLPMDGDILVQFGFMDLLPLKEGSKWHRQFRSGEKGLNVTSVLGRKQIMLWNVEFALYIYFPNSFWHLTYTNIDAKSFIKPSVLFPSRFHPHLDKILISLVSLSLSSSGQQLHN